jgi:UDP-sugar diphosphatase
LIEIEKISILGKGKFLELKEVFFNYFGKKRRWEVCSSHDSVAILIYDKDLDALILVKQFRLPVYLKNGNGYTLELCAGLCDKNKSNVEIAKEEVLEECGYDVDVKSIRKITSTWASVGSSAARQEIFYVEVDGSMKVNEGGGIDDEDIEVMVIPSNEVYNKIFDENTVLTPGAKFAMLWWCGIRGESVKM